MFTFIITFTVIGFVSGASCGRLSYEGRHISERTAQTYIWALMGTAGGLVLSTLICSAMLNMGVAV